MGKPNTICRLRSSACVLFIDHVGKKRPELPKFGWQPLFIYSRMHKHVGGLRSCALSRTKVRGESSYEKLNQVTSNN